MTLPNNSSLPPKPAAPESPSQRLAADFPDKPAYRDQPRSASNRGGLAWFAVGLFQVGLLAGLYSSYIRAHSQAGAKDSVSPGLHGMPDSGSNARPAALSERSPTDVAAADDFLRRGWYERALTQYEAATEMGADESPGRVPFRIALCLDGLGRHDRAIAAYAEIADRHPDTAISHAARLASARLSVRRRDIEASKRSLGHLLLKSAAHARTAKSNVVELCGLLGLVLAMDVAGTEKPGPQSEFAIAFPEFGWRPETLLDAAESGGGEPAERPAGKPADSFSVNARPNGPGICDCDVSVAADHIAAFDVIERVAYVANIPCVWTDAARDSARHAKIDAATDWLNWPALIECLTGPLQIAWELRDEKLCLSTCDETSDEARGSGLVNAARLILAASMRDGRGGVDPAIAWLGLGNLEFVDGRDAEAATWFERLTNESPRSAQVFQAYFNLGTVRRSLREIEEARSAYLHAVDISPIHPLAPLAYLYVGRMHLDDYELERAIPPLRRSASMAADSETRAAATVEAATAMLLAKSWRAAHTLLAEQRGAIDQPFYRDAAAFLETYARFHLPSGRKRSQQEAQALVSALVGLKTGATLPAAGVLLVGDAYAELGLDEQMATTLEQALKRGVSKPIAHEISCELAEFSHLAGRQEEAVKRLSVVFTSASPAKARQAGLRIAEINLANNRIDECLRICRKMLADTDKEDAATILRLMGKAFEQAGDHPRAAQCFAGRLPAERRPPASP